MAIPAWKLQLQQSIAKKKSEKQKQEEQRRIQLLPPWKRAALEHQNVIIIPNSTSKSSTKPTTTVAVSKNSPTKTVSTNSHPTTNNVKTVNSNISPTRTVSFVNANQRSPTHNVTIKPKDNGSTTSSYSTKPANHVSLKQSGKSKSVDAIIDRKKTSVVSSSESNLLNKSNNDSDGEFGVADDHCISVHNNPFLRREKKMGGLGKPKLSTVANAAPGLGNRQKVQDSTSPNSTSRVAWKSKPQSNDVSPGEKSTTSNNNTSSKNNYITKKVQPPEPEEAGSSGRPSRSTERKLSVNEILKQFGRAASHEEKQKIRRQGSLEEARSPTSSPRSVSTHRDYSERERSPSPVKNRYRSAQKPRPKSSPIEISTSVILSQGRKSPVVSPQPVRKATYGSGANCEKTQAAGAPVTNSSNKVIINTSSKQQAPKAPAPKISVSDKSSSEKPPVTLVTNGSPGVILLNKKQHLVDTHDAGRTPPPRRKTPLPASAIIDLNTAGPIQQASGKPPVDPEQIAKEKTVSIPKNTQDARKSGTHIQTRDTKAEGDFEKPKPNTVSNLLGAFGQNKARAPVPPSPSTKTTSVKEDTQVNAIPYPEDFRRPKSWQAKQQVEKALPSKANLKRTEPDNSEKERNEKNASISQTTREKPVDLTPIPRPSSETISPIPKSDNVSPIPNREIISSDTKTVTQNGHIGSKAEESESRGKGQASKEMMEKARALKKVKKKVNYEVIGGNAPTGKPSAQTSKSGRNRNKSQLKLTFRDDPEEFEYQSEASLLAEYGDEEEEEEEEDGRHSSVSEDEEPSPGAPPPTGFRDNVPKGTGGLQSYTPSYLRDMTPSMMREHQEATRRKEEAAKQPEPEPAPYDEGDYFSSAGSNSAAMLF